MDTPKCFKACIQQELQTGVDEDPQKEIVAGVVMDLFDI